MPRLDLYYLGPPQIELDNQPVELRLAKANALLAYLAVNKQTHSREALATLLWPESDTDHGRTSLRSIILEINNTLGRMWLATGRQTVGLQSDADIWLDVEHFRARIAACQTHGHSKRDVCPRCIPLLNSAVNLYQGDFMAGFSLRDSTSFDEWLIFQAERSRKEQADALEHIINFYQAHNPKQLNHAISHARRWVELDPLNELAHQQLMRLYIQTGQRTEALRQYQLCEQMLQTEFGVSPSKALTRLYQHIEQNTPLQILAATSPPPSPTPMDTAPPSTSARPSKLKLPPQLTPFVGRKEERATLGVLLRDTPNCRLVSLVGPGGVGKTRLAAKVTADISTTFADGIAYVPLDSVDFPEYLLPSIAEALNLPLGEDSVSLDAICQHLQTRKLLLILDNFDSMLQHVIVLQSILQAAPGVKILVTSQEPLHLQGEWLIKVPGLPYPPKDRVDNAPSYSAVQLFLQTAERVHPSFTAKDTDWPWIARICHAVDGLPLGIELAATWVRLLSCPEIARRIEDNLEFLSTSLRNVPERHRSLRAVFNHTWQLLSDEERRVYQQISVFVGGFREKAAAQVAYATLPVLLALVDRGLLRRQDSGRYDRHPLLWGYAAEKLARNPQERDAVHERHSIYYTAFLKEHLDHLKIAPHKATLELIEEDIDNIRSALQWAVTHHPQTETAQMLEHLYYDYERRAWLRGRSLTLSP